MAYKDGTFEKTKDGYRFRKNFISKTTGNSVRLSVSGRTQDECRKKMAAKIREKEASIKRGFEKSVENDAVPLQDGISDWLKNERFGAVKYSTYDRMERTFNNNIRNTWLGVIQAAKVTQPDVRRFLKELPSTMSDSSKSKVYELLNQFFRYYYSSRPYDSPMNGVEKPKTNHAIREISVEDEGDQNLEDIVLSNEEIKRFKEVAFRPYVNGSKHSTKHGVDLYFIMMTVVRFGEATAVTWKDISVESRKMIISKNQSHIVNRDGGDAKTKSIITTPKNGKAREVMLSAEALEALEEIRKRSNYTGQTDFVITGRGGGMASNHTLTKTLKSVLTEAGLMTLAREKKFGLHYLRHTGISYYLRNGIPIELVSKMAGHSSVAITERVYYHIIHDQQKLMLDMMDNIKL